MGIGNSKQRYERRRAREAERREPIPSNKRRQRASIFRRRLPTPTTQAIAPIETDPAFYRTSYGSYPSLNYNYGYPPMPLYYPPMRYNNVLPHSYLSPPHPQQQQPMMVVPQRPPALPMPMPQPSPYVQAPVFNNVPAVVPMPAGNPLYPSQPGRLLTDWTGGGQISPGFLGPPI